MLEDGLEVHEISVHDAYALLQAGEATFVDVRDPGSHAMARVPGALPVSDGDVDDFVCTADRARPLVVYCYHGHSSIGGAAFFQAQGFARVFSMQGGYTAWDYAGLPREGPATLPG